jgi:hypothetical protein
MILRPALLRRSLTLPLLAATALIALAASFSSPIAAWAAGPQPSEGRAGPAGPNRLERSKIWPEPLAARPRFAEALTDLQQPSLETAAFDAFVESVADGRAGVLRGVYVPGVLALRVVQQPASKPYMVDMTPGVATQYGLARSYGVTGLLADNVASGVLYYALSPGQEVTLVYGDGSLRHYLVERAERFQALRPRDPYTDFINLDTGGRLSATALFTQMYTGGDKITFQTCIAQDGQMAWGRLFVTATPVD